MRYINNVFISLNKTILQFDSKKHIPVNKKINLLYISIILNDFKLQKW
jgi:hypothetical protein